VLDLAPFIDSAKQQLTESGLTIASQIPEIHPTIAIGDTKNLVQARTAYSTLDRLATWLPWITAAILALAVYLPQNHRRALLSAGLGVASTMLILAAALTITRAILINNVPSRSTPATAATFDILVRFLREALRTTLVLALIIALAAFLTGPSITAVHLRTSAARFLTLLRKHAGKPTPSSRWIHTHRNPLRAATITLAALTFVFLDPPTVQAVLVTAALLSASLAAIQFLAHPPPDQPT
jgi:hypothetical protein